MPKERGLTLPNDPLTIYLNVPNQHERKRHVTAASQLKKESMLQVRLM
jgi:hypothetical protein